MKKMYKVLVLFAALSGAIAVMSSSSFGFGEMQGACEPDCTRCHSLSMEEASAVVKEINPEIEVLNVSLSPVGGLWEVVVKAKGKRGLAYVDFSKQYLITGDIIKVSTKKNITDTRMYELSKVDVTAIPLEEAILVGSPDARFKSVIFSDPDCPYCRKLHKEIKQIVKDRTDIAFYIKLLPLKIHPAAYKKSKAIVCERSLRLLERAFDGRTVPSPTCETTEVDDTIEMAERMGITGTPTIVLPDGGVINGFRDSVALQQAIETAGLAAEEREREAIRKQQEELDELKDKYDEGSEGSGGSSSGPEHHAPVTSGEDEAPSQEPPTFEDSIEREVSDSL